MVIVSSVTTARQVVELSGPEAMRPGPVSQRAQRLVHIPMERFAEPEELAAAVAFLASDDSPFKSSAGACPRPAISQARSRSSRSGPGA